MDDGWKKRSVTNDCKSKPRRASSDNIHVEMGQPLNEHYMWHMEILRRTLTHTHPHCILYIVYLFYSPFSTWWFLFVANCVCIFFFSSAHSLLFVCSFNRFLVLNLFHYSLSLPNTLYLYHTQFFLLKGWHFHEESLTCCVCGLFKIWQTKQTTNLSWTCNTTQCVCLNYDRFFSINNFILISTVLFVGFSLINAIYDLLFNEDFHPICKKINQN